MALSGAKFSCVNEFLGAYRIVNDSITKNNHYGSEYKLYQEVIFKKVKNRDKARIDHFYHFAFKIAEYLENPHIFFDRLLYGKLIPTRKSCV